MKLADHAGTQHQLMADDDGIGRRFFKSREQELTGAHVAVVSLQSGIRLGIVRLSQGGV